MRSRPTTQWSRRLIRKHWKWVEPSEAGARVQSNMEDWGTNHDRETCGPKPFQLTYTSGTDVLLGYFPMELHHKKESLVMHLQLVTYKSSAPNVSSKYQMRPGQNLTTKPKNVTCWVTRVTPYTSRVHHGYR